jgi:hypothetical protein
MTRDPEIGVRATALGGYIVVNERERDPGALRFLAQLVQDESLPMDFRDVAYQGLYQVGGRHVNDWPIVRACPGRFTFPADVDWFFVARCRDGS